MSTTVVPNVRRLAQYRPFERGGLDLRAVFEDLVLAVATINDGSVESLLGCRHAFLDLWGVEVEVDELRPVFDGLIERKIAEPAGKGIRCSRLSRPRCPPRRPIGPRWSRSANERHC
jgi:hypothetical protein